MYDIYVTIENIFLFQRNYCMCIYITNRYTLISKYEFYTNFKYNNVCEIIIHCKKSIDLNKTFYNINLCSFHIYVY